MREDSREECKLEYEKLVLADSPPASHHAQAKRLIQRCMWILKHGPILGLVALARKASFLANAGVVNTEQSTVLNNQGLCGIKSSTAIS